MSNQLMHYGVPRRSGRYPFGSGERPYQSTKRRLHAQNRASDQTKVEKMAEYDGDPAVNFPEEYNHDRVIKKGSSVYRYSTEKNELNEGATFVFYDSNDQKQYEAYAKDGLLEVEKGKKSYLNHYTVKKDVQIPSTQKLVDTYIDTVLKSNSVMDKTLNEVFARDGKKVINDLLKKDDLENVSVTEAHNALVNEFLTNPQSSFKRFMVSTLKGGSNDTGEVGKKFLDEVSKEYDAIPDFYDTRYADAPLFILDRSKTLEYVDSDKPFVENYKMEITK